MKNDWFEVDKNGLRKLRADTPKSTILYELISNVLDTDATECEVSIKPLGKGLCELMVRDNDPEGFRYLSHAYTLFAESIRKGDAHKRGRFNFGEKISVAMCEKATIVTTKGTVVFDKNGRHEGRAKTQVGSVFTGVVRMSAAQQRDLERAVAKILLPEGIVFRFQGELLKPRKPIKVISDVILPTVLADAQGVVRATKRKTVVEVHAVPPGQVSWVYELGIPVVETGDAFDYNVLQKVPLTMDRGNVTTSFLREVRTAVAEAMLDHIDAKNASSEWVRAAASNAAASPALVKRVVHQRFGPKTVIYDPSDKEANAKAVAQGYALIHGGSLNKDEWENVRKHEAALPAGKLFPTNPGRRTKRFYVPYKKLTTGMRNTAALAVELAYALMQVDLSVRFILDPGLKASAGYGDNCLVFNLAKLPADFFDHGPDESVLSLLIHEFGHHYESNHLSAKYYEALSDLGARLALVVLEQPEILKPQS